MVNGQYAHSDLSLWPSTGSFNLTALVAACWQTYRERRQLGRLEPHLLADIGITPEMARQESNRRIWQLPARHIH